MTVYLNSKPIANCNASNLLDLLKDQGFAEKKGIAVAVNNAVIRKNDWELYTLTEGDKIIIISATKGG